MTFEEAKVKLFQVKWKTTLCHQGEDCWCRIIKHIKILNLYPQVLL